MAYYKLIRQPAEGNAVRGKLYKVAQNGDELYLCNTLENAEYIIPALTYRMCVTESPKFRRMMPLVCQVPGHSGIRIHRGSRPEHSTGCILVRDSDTERYLAYNMLSEQNYESLQLEIVEN